MKSTLRTDMERAARQNNWPALQVLLCSVTRDTAQEKRALKCLLLAIEKGHEALALELLRWGMDVDGMQPSRGLTPLLACAMWNRDGVARELIALGADLQKRDRFGWTPLIEAAMGGALETVQVLVEAGADLESDNSGTPLAWAAHRGKIAVIEYLASRGALIDPPLLSPLLNAIYMGQFEAVQVLVRLGAQRERPQWSWSRGAPWNALDFARSQREPDARIIALLEAASRQQV